MSEPAQGQYPAAALAPTLQPPPGMARAPLVPQYLAGLAAMLSAALTPLAAVLPHPFGFVCGVLAFVAAFLAGVALPQPRWVEGKPLVAQVAVPALLSVAPVLVQVSQVLPEGLPRYVVYGLALLASGLAGKAMPQPVR